MSYEYKAQRRGESRHDGSELGDFAWEGRKEMANRDMLNRMIFCGVGLILLLEPLSAVQGWSPPFRVSPLGTGSCVYPAVCVDGGGGVWVTWFNSRHLYSRFCDNDNWSDVILVDSVLTTTSPVVRSSAMCRDTMGQVWVAWEDSGGYEMGHIRLSYFDPRDSVWHTSIRDDRLRGGAPGITCDTLNNIWCSWTGFTTLVDSNFYIMAGCYDGDSWTRFDTLAILPPVLMSQTAGITTDISGNIWVCFNGLGWIYAQCFDGSNWSSQEYIGTCDEMAHPTICSDSSGNIWVAWWAKMYVRWAGSDTWSEIQLPNSDTAYAFWAHPDICSDFQGRIWMGFAEIRRYHFDSLRVCGTYYQEGDWKDLTILDKDSPHNPVIAYSGDRVWLVWSSVKEGSNNIYISHNCATMIDEYAAAKNEEVRLNVYPSLFASTTSIEYVLPKSGNVQMVVYNLLGEDVMILTDEKQRAGSHTLSWDVTDNAGRRVPSGTYFVRLEAGNYTATRKVCVVRWL